MAKMVNFILFAPSIHRTAISLRNKKGALEVGILKNNLKFINVGFWLKNISVVLTLQLFIKTLKLSPNYESSIHLLCKLHIL